MIEKICIWIIRVVVKSSDSQKFRAFGLFAYWEKQSELDTEDLSVGAR